MKGRPLQKLLQYTIKKGDTLSAIARDNNIDLLDLLEANKQIKNPDVIYADDTLNIPQRVMPEKKVVGFDVDAPPAKKIDVEMSDLIPKKETRFPVRGGTKPKDKSESELIKTAKVFGINIDESVARDFEKRGGVVKDRVVPLFVRQFAYDSFGGDDDITASDFSRDEYQVVQQAVADSINNNKNTIDYNTLRNVGATKGDVRTNNFDWFNPADSVQMTLGQANIVVEDNGDIYVRDQYNWNDGGDKEKRYKTSLHNDRGYLPLTEASSFNNLVYRFARNFKTLTGRGEGEGSKVNVYIGNMDNIGRRNFAIGGVAKALSGTITNAASKRGQKLRKSYLDRKHLEKLDETVGERFVSLTMIKDLLEDGDINISEAIDYLKAAGYKKSVINKFIRPYKEIGLS